MRSLLLLPEISFSSLSFWHSECAWGMGMREELSRGKIVWTEEATPFKTFLWLYTHRNLTKMLLSISPTIPKEAGMRSKFRINGTENELSLTFGVGFMVPVWYKMQTPNFQNKTNSISKLNRLSSAIDWHLLQRYPFKKFHQNINLWNMCGSLWSITSAVDLWSLGSILFLKIHSQGESLWAPLS